jgi:(hydroxyamino)benzene mutase
MRTPIDLRLARHGAILLLLGMLTGFVIVKFHNRGAGNAAHLTGLIGGYGLIALGLLWPKLNLGRFWSGAGAWITATSLYLNWLGLVLQGGFGSGPKATNSPLLGSPVLWDHAGGAVLLVAVILSLLSVLIVLIGLRPRFGSSELPY